MSNVRVLVVDDAKFILERVRKIVSQAFPDFELEMALNGQEAQKLMSASVFDIILCDWEMPEVSGLELLQWTRKHPPHKDVAFLMVTSRGERDYVLQAIKAGVNDYLGKPFNADHLVEKMLKLLAKADKLDPAMKQRGLALIEAEKRRREQAKVKAAATPAPAPSKKPPVADRSAARATPNAKGLAQLRTSQGTYRCAIKDLSLQEVMIVVKNDGQLPQVLDQVVVDIEQLSGDSVARVNGFIYQSQAAERRSDSPFVHVKVQFVDDDPDKLAHLSKYIASVR
ncbi:MAG: response regulator [Marinobacterium sp.]|nr:response regulator [Marinobacterium sp.]